MIGLDTNILVRYFERDDPAQAHAAELIIEHRLSSANPGYLTVVALVELSWVLERSYKRSQQEIGNVLEALLSNEVFEIQNELQVHVAYRAVRDGRGSFADALIGSLGLAAGCNQTLTFDRGAMLLPGFTLL
jgi:predicted nucleic-acid-binding protein